MIKRELKREYEKLSVRQQKRGNMKNDIRILRELANKYALIAFDDHQKEMYHLHASTNDLSPIRPVVLIHELPWHELNVDGSLTLQCEDEDFRRVEQHLRRTIFQWTYFPADMLVQPYLSIEKVIESTGIGVEVKEETASVDAANHIVSHKYEDQFCDMEDLEKLHSPIITYDRAETMRRFEKIADAIGDIIPVKITGANMDYSLGLITWDIIAQHMSIDNLLYNLIDEPEFMHSLARKFADIYKDTIRQYEEQNLFNPDSPYIHCTPAASRVLKNSIQDYDNIRACNIWGRGLAQIFSSVSPDMHDEFDIQYAKEVLEPFGYVYYGCCEPLDTKIDILRQIKNLRKISISPWANVHVAAEAIGSDYVLSAKPSPSNLTCAASQPEVIEKEIREILRAGRANNCPLELVLKDISTANYKLENLVTWERTAMELVKNQ